MKLFYKKIGAEGTKTRSKMLRIFSCGAFSRKNIQRPGGKSWPGETPQARVSPRRLPDCPRKAKCLERKSTQIHDNQFFVVKNQKIEPKMGNET
ncbi:hypothetical protein [Bacillus sp. FJAT-27445]|uniref:hypothetical protein n=1 Tax=Bacillus sp. FJAT-27445 TaxID=1679166 RepID=UPI000AF8B381|nr:hypothetical protein [Bacillus sp. FJAT-27445]